MLELSDTLDTSRLMKVSTADRFAINSQSRQHKQRTGKYERNSPNDIPISSTRNDIELLMLHDIE